MRPLFRNRFFNYRDNRVFGYNRMVADQGLNEQQKQKVNDSYEKVNGPDFFEKDIDSFIRNLVCNKVLK